MCARRVLLVIAAAALAQEPQRPELRIEPTEAALREALARVAAAGGGRITFQVSNASIEIQDRIYFYGHNLVLDGEDRNITFKYTGPDRCDQTEGQDPFIEIHGNRNVIRNFTLDGFPDGIHIQSGYDNLVENVRFPKVCEDAITNSGRGFEAFRTVIRNCYFENAEDKAIMINNGGSVTVEECEFLDCQQPVRAGGRSGRYAVRKCVFKGRSTGPRFSGGEEGMFVDFEDNLIQEARYGIRLYGYVNAVLRRNRFYPRPSDGYGVYIYEKARVRLEANVVQGAAKGGVVVQDEAQVDLGGGRVVICGDSEPSQGGNVLRGNQPADLINLTDVTVAARFNYWDHQTPTDVLAHDVTGPAEVEPLGREEGALAAGAPQLLSWVRSLKRRAATTGFCSARGLSYQPSLRSGGGRTFPAGWPPARAPRAADQEPIRTAP